MNKSKFLKKSLAMLLAMLMVVAMIPLGASAAEVPAVTSVKVNGKAVTLSGTTGTVTVPSSTSTSSNLEVVTAGGKGQVAYDGAFVSATNGIFTTTLAQDSIDNKQVKFSVWDSDTVNSQEYTITLTFAVASTDNGVKAIGLETKSLQYGSTTVVNGVHTITTAYEGVNPASDFVLVTLNDASATLTVNSGASINSNADGVYKLAGYTVGANIVFTVTSEAGTSRRYTAVVNNPDYFPSFSVTGETEETEVDATLNTITVNLPYGTETVKDDNSVEYYVVPVNFTVGYPSVKVTSTAVEYPAATSAKEVKSGAKLYVPVLSGSVTLDYSYPSSTGTKTFTLSVTVPANDDKAVVSAVKIGNYNANISGNTITVELPASFMSQAGSNALTMQVKASKGAAVSLIGAASTATGNADTWVTMSATFDGSAESTNTLRVVSSVGTDPAYTDYTLVVKKVGIDQEARLLSMVLTAPDDTTYTAVINGRDVTFNVPFSTEPATLSDSGKEWTLEYGLSNGAVSSMTYASGDKLTSADVTAIFPDTFDGKDKGNDITVTASNNSQNVFNVIVKKLPAEIGKSITAFGVTAVTDDADVTEDNVYTGKVSGTNITVEVPYSEYNFAAANSVVPVNVEVSKGAKVYYKTAASTAAALAPIDVEGKTDGTAISVPGSDFNGTETSASDKTPKTLELIVVSEGGTAPTTYNNAWKLANSGKYQSYKLIVKQVPARVVLGAPVVTLFDNTTKETVTGSIAGSTITFGNIPAHFVGDTLYIDFKVNNGETVATSVSAGSIISPIVYDEDGNYKSGGVALTGLAADGTGASVTTLYVESEDGDKITTSPSAAATYAVSYKVADPETGATLSSVSINNVVGKPDSKNVINITLPVGTEITSLVPNFTVSKYARIYLGDPVNNQVVNNGVSAYNFTADQTFTVVSEDGKSSKTYTIHVEASQSFDDVKSSDWFYSVVMRAFNLGIVKGVSATKFNPNGNVTRGQFALFIARADGYNQNAYMTESSFKDVPAGTETSAAIDYCQKMGYLGGYGDGTFKPNKNITRAEMAKIVANAMGLPETTGEGFADVKGNWAEGYIYAVKNAGIIDGKSATKFDPNGLTKRSEAAKVVMGVYDAK